MRLPPQSANSYSTSVANVVLTGNRMTLANHKSYPVSFGWRGFFVGKHYALQDIARLREALITNKPADSSWRDFF